MKTAVLIGLSRHRINVDGAGVTTLVAFHGCPLNCKYCLNPQALSPESVWKRFSPVINETQRQVPVTLSTPQESCICCWSVRGRYRRCTCSFVFSYCLQRYEIFGLQQRFLQGIKKNQPES